MLLSTRSFVPLVLAGLLPLLPLAAQQPAAPSLDTVRVVARTSSAAAATRSVEMITHEQLVQRAGRSLAEVLGFALGIDAGTRSPAQADLSIRGSSFNQVVVLVDGVRVSDVQSGHYALDLAVPTAMIERIEILRGTGSALYGSDAIGGIVNIVTRTDAHGGELSARGGSYGGAEGSAASFGTTHETGLRVAADVDRSDGHRTGTDYRAVQARVAAEHGSPMGRVVGDVGEGVRQFGAANFYSPYPSAETTRSATAAIRLVAPDTARVALAGSVHLRRHDDLFTLVRDDPARYQNQHTSVETGGDLSLRSVLAPAVVGVIGAELLDARLASARLGDHRQDRRGAFGQLTLGAAGRPTLDLGLRGDWLSDEGAFLSPSAAAALPVSRTTVLRASVSRGFRAPTWTERFYVDPANVADSSLAVERFWSTEIGGRAIPFPWLGADVALFERRATDLIDWAKPAGAPGTTPWRTANFAGAVYRGLEASLALPTLPGAEWTVHASGLQFDASAAAGTVGKYALRPITRSVGVSALRSFGPGAAVTLDALRSRRAGEADHLQVNARLEAPAGALRASLALVNLTDASYLDAAGQPVAGRSVFAGLAWAAR